MSRLKTVVPALLVAALLAWLVPSPAAAGTRLALSGTFTQTSFGVTPIGEAGDLSFLRIAGTDALTGTLTGASTITGVCIAFPSARWQCKVDETFTGTVNGVSGTLQFRVLARIDVGAGSVAGRFVVVDGSGGLSRVHGTGTFSGAGGAGTYTGVLTVAV